MSFGSLAEAAVMGTGASDRPPQTRAAVMPIRTPIADKPAAEPERIQILVLRGMLVYPGAACSSSREYERAGS